MSEREGRIAKTSSPCTGVLQGDNNYFLLPSSVTLSAAPSLETLHGTHGSKTKHERTTRQSMSPKDTHVQITNTHSQVCRDCSHTKRLCACVCVCVTWLQSPGYGGHTPSVFVDKVAAGVEDPAVVEGHEGVSGCGGRVLAILAVSILQGGELVLPQHLVHNKRPGGNTQRHARDFTATERVGVMNTLGFFFYSKSMILVADLASRLMRVYCFEGLNNKHFLGLK